MASLLWLPVIGWLVSPIISFLMNKLLSYLDFNLSRKLEELKFNVIPSLKQILGDVTEQRMLRGAKDEGNGSESDLKTLGELEEKLKFALYDADDVLDLVDYRHTEKKVISGDGKSQGTSISSRVLQAIGDCIACCKRSSFGQKLWQCAQNLNQKLRYLGEKLQQCAQDLDLKFSELVAKLQQYAQNMKQMLRDLPLRATLVQCAQSLPLYIRQEAPGQPSMPDAPVARSAAEFRDVIELGSATMPSPMPVGAPSNPPSPNAVPNSAGSVTEFRGDNQHGSAQEAPTLDAPTNALVQIVQIAWDCFGFVFALLCSFYLTVRHLRDWCCKAFCIKNDDDTATDWVLSINEIVSLRKRIKNIEYTISDSKKSPLSNQNSSSSTTSKDADKESSSSCTVKNSAEESTSTQKEIDDLYRSIEKKVFGRDKDREHISRMLREGPDAYAASSSTSKPYSVIGIYGITGSGKSTLAQYVCDYEKGAEYFNLIMFIHVGKTFSVGDIFRDMLEQITQSRPPNDKDLKSLKKELEEKLKDECFLLVLDDLWVNDKNQKERDILLDTLSAALRGSRVLVTSQKKDAAQALGAQEQISIPDLEEGVYLSMFMNHARPHASDDDGEYERIGRKIANRLGRSPIAAVTVGKQLQRNKSISFWETTANLDVLNKTMGALWWSYQQLGDDIRRCFAYCCTFPKGYGLKRNQLVGMWIAQGFVNTRSNAREELEDVGQHYFDELLTFSFLQKEWTFSKEFRIHDLLHELAKRISGSEFERIGLNGSPEDIPRGVHHLFIETKNVAEINEKILDLGNLRTLIIKEDRYEMINEDSAEETPEIDTNYDLERLLELLFMRLKKLRVLIIEVNFVTAKLLVPKPIGHMKHLRYLAFHFHDGLWDLILPWTFSKLYHIQNIDIPCEETSCPEDMGNLICLQHISAPQSVPNIGRFTSLRTLTMFEVTEEQGYGLKQLKHLNKLRGTLTIEGLGIVGSKKEALEAHLDQKERLRTLELKFWHKRFAPDVEAEVLEGLCPPKDLQELTIWWYNGSRYPTWLSSHHPGALKQLHTLVLSGCSQMASSIPEDSELFIGLRLLEISFCHWKRLPENMERLVSLTMLKLSHCYKMELLPTLPHKSLKMIFISWCDVLSKTCKEEGHENWHKIQHIPEKVIG